jgi:fused signal recognition particle receptor
VIFDAYNFAANNGYDILIADTAGRLHTKKNLMDELKKVTKVLKKLDPTAPHEVMLVLDASVGQNSLNQVKSFHEAVNITGLTITKLDGTAKAGIIFSIANTTGLPIRFIGVGEQISDLKHFNAEQFISALCERED